MDDCCGGSPVTPFPQGVNADWPCLNYCGTTTPIAGVQTPLMSWQGFKDASTILGGEISWSPPDDPATVTLTEIRPPRQRAYVAFPDACFLAPPGCYQKLDITAPTNWKLHAEVLRLLYNDPPLAAKTLQSIVPCVEFSWVQPDDETTVPGSLIVQTPDWNLVYLTGTTNFQQRVWQAARGGNNPVDFGDYSTLPFWFEIAAAIINRIVATGMEWRDNWFIAGHSMGGALASIIAASMHLGYPEREITLYTEGCPCVGDYRLREVLSDLVQVHLQNDGDPVCSMPPNDPFLDLVSSLLPDGLYPTWKLWRPHNRRFELFADGSFRAVNSGSVTFAILKDVVEHLAVGELPGDYAAHGSDVYLTRTNLIP